MKIKDTYFFKIIKKCFFDFFSLSEVKLDQKSDFDQILKKVKNSFFEKFKKICEKALLKFLFKRFSIYQDPVNVTKKKKVQKNMLDVLG